MPADAVDGSSAASGRNSDSVVPIIDEEPLEASVEDRAAQSQARASAEPPLRADGGPEDVRDPGGSDRAPAARDDRAASSPEPEPSPERLPERRGASASGPRNVRLGGGGGEISARARRSWLNAATLATAEASSRVALIRKAAPASPWARLAKMIRDVPGPTKALLCVSAATLAWMLATTFAAPPFGINSGKNGDACVGTPTEGSLCLCPRKTVCATEWHEVVFLAFARASAYFDYPMYLLLFVSKCHNLRGAMYRTHLKEILPLSDVHHLHVFAGAVVSVEVIWHSFWHFARWASGGDARFLVDTQTGVTGVIALLVTPLICYPMMFHRARRAISFEYRKAMHYLAVVWGVCVMLHAPATNVLWVMGSAVGLYVADWAVGYFLKVRYCPTMTMIRLGPKAVEIVFENPRGFLPNLSGGGYVYLCLPWIGSFQWHAFSVYEHPTLKNHSSVCVLKAGDWTTALHAALTKPSNKPGWVYGPFPSPFLTASNHENIIAVASGIGITPTLGTVVSLGGTRRVNVVWTCRDAELIEYALRTVAFSKEAFTVIYYTGEHELLLDEGPFRENHNLLVIAGRPNLEKIILEIMRSVETKKPLSVHTLEAANQMYVKTFTRDGGERLEVLLKRIRLSYSASELFELARAASLEAEIEARDAEAEARSSSLDHPASLQAAAPRPRLRTTSATISGLIQQCIVGITLRGLDKFIRDAQRGAGLGRPGHGGVDVRSYGTTLKMVFEQHDANSSGELDESQFARVLSTLSSSGEADVEASRERGGGGHRAPVYRRALVRAAASLESILTAKYEGPNFENFQILYCGGAATVVRMLRAMRKTTGVDVQIESFEW